MQHSVSVVRKEQEHDSISYPVSTLSTRSALHYDHHNNGLHFLTHRLHNKHMLHSFICMCQQSCLQHRTWEEMKVRVRRIHWEIRLKDDECNILMKEKWCNFIIWCLFVLYLCLNLYLSIGVR